jgi:hypothetical protein
MTPDEVIQLADTIKQQRKDELDINNAITVLSDIKHIDKLVRITYRLGQSPTVNEVEVPLDDEVLISIIVTELQNRLAINKQNKNEVIDDVTTLALPIKPVTVGFTATIPDTLVGGTGNGNTPANP